MELYLFEDAVPPLQYFDLFGISYLQLSRLNFYQAITLPTPSKWPCHTFDSPQPCVQYRLSHLPRLHKETAITPPANSPIKTAHVTPTRPRACAAILTTSASPTVSAGSSKKIVLLVVFVSTFLFSQTGQANGTRAAPTPPGPPDRARTSAPAPTPKAAKTRPLAGPTSSPAPTTPSPNSSIARAQMMHNAPAGPRASISPGASSPTTAMILPKTQAPARLLRSRIIRPPVPTAPAPRTVRRIVVAPSITGVAQLLEQKQRLAPV